MCKIIFDDGDVRILVAKDLSIKECEDLIKEQEKPEFYSIFEQDSHFRENRRRENKMKTSEIYIKRR